MRNIKIIEWENIKILGDKLNRVRIEEENIREKIKEDNRERLGRLKFLD